MLILDRNAPEGAEPVARLTLPFERRVRSRQFVVLDDGREAALALARGRVLRDGDRLASACGTVVDVRAAVEPLTEARTADLLHLARAAYHLGNRHVAVQVGPGWLRIVRDSVLGRMLAGLGCEVVEADAVFEPEAGAYGGHAHEPGHAGAGRIHDFSGGGAVQAGHTHSHGPAEAHAEGQGPGPGQGAVAPADDSHA